MKTTILRAAAVLLPVLALLATPAPGVEMQVAGDFSRLGKTAKDKNVVILISVTQEHCPFCRKIKEEILKPMLLSGEYGDKVLIRELSIDPGETVTDFEGNQRMAADFADGYQVWVTPTLLFLGPDGTEMTQRMLGVQTVEMYGYYVDQSIEQALQRLHDTDAERYRPSAEDIGAYPPLWDDLSH